MTDIDTILEEFERLWRGDQPPQLEQFVAALDLSGEQRQDVLTELIAVDMEYQTRSAAQQETLLNYETDPKARSVSPLKKPHVTLDDYRRRWLDLFQNVREFLPLIAEEYRIRHRWGDRPGFEEYIQRFGEIGELRRELEAIQRELLLDTQAEVAADARERVAESLPNAELPRQFGRYRLLERLGQGGMGEVFRAVDTQLNRQVALKIPRLDKSLPQLRERFLNEARATATLRHPHICPVFDTGELDGHPFLTMAYIEGRDLHALWQAGEHQSVQEMLPILSKVARAIQAAHDQQVVHRDVKPPNVMLETNGEPVVTDFGLAHRTEEAADPRLTQTGEIFGSPAYMSPEQVEGRTDGIGPATDIYSLGVMLFETLTGRLPFTGSRGQITAAILRDEPPKPSDLKPGVDSELESLCLRMLAKNPSVRPVSMTEVASQLDRIQQRLDSGETIAEPISQAFRSDHNRNKGWLWALLGCAAMVLLGLFVTIQTDKGAIVVRSDVPGVEVLIRQGEKTVERFETRIGEKSTTIYSGKYAIVVQGDNDDDLKVSPTLVTLTRNKTEVVTVAWIGTGVAQESEEFTKWLEEMESLSGRERFSKTIAKLQELNPGYDGKVQRVDFRGTPETNTEFVFHLELRSDQLREISPLQAFRKLARLHCDGSTGESGQLTNLSPLAKLSRLEHVSVAKNPQLSDMTPLQGLKRLQHINVDATGLSDLSLLKGLKQLTTVSISSTEVSDLTPLKGNLLQHFNCSQTRVTDLSPLAGMTSLKVLQFRFTKISDLTPLKGMKLNGLYMNGTDVTDLLPLKGMPIQTLELSAADVEDLNLLRELPLSVLTCYGFPSPDLSVLQGMQLKQLSVQKGGIKSLSPLRGMPLVFLDLRYNREISDLSPLKGMKLERLHLDQANVSDLSPLAGMPLSHLWLYHTRATNFTALAEMPLDEIVLPPEVNANMLAVLRSIKSLKTINKQPAEIFWKRHAPPSSNN